VGGIKAGIMKNLLCFSIAAIASLEISQPPAMAIANLSPSPTQLTEEYINFDVEPIADTIIFGFVCCQSLLLFKLANL
jgi:hypothetical protein